MRFIERYDPAVDRRYLILIAGTVWGLVGMVLCAVAFRWLGPAPRPTAAALGLASLALAVLIGTFGFARIVRENLKRIQSRPGKACLFSFQPWRSYLLVAVMVALGALLRRSSMPRPYLAVIYLSIGGAMLVSSLRYFREFLGSASRP